MNSLLATVIWAVGYFLSSLYVCLAIPSWPEEFLFKDQLLSLWESPCVLFVVFPLLLLIFALCVLLICVLGYSELGCFTSEVYPVWDSLGFLDLVIISFPILGKFSTIISSKIFSWSFFLPSSSGTPMIRMLGHLTLFQQYLMLPSFLFILFPSLLHLFPPFYLPPHFSYLLLQLFYCWFPSECF